MQFTAYQREGETHQCSLQPSKGKEKHTNAIYSLAKGRRNTPMQFTA